MDHLCQSQRPGIENAPITGDNEEYDDETQLPGIWSLLAAGLLDTCVNLLRYVSLSLLSLSLLSGLSQVLRL